MKLFRFTRHWLVDDEFDYKPVWREDSILIAASNKKEAETLLPPYFDPNSSESHLTVIQAEIKRGVVKFQ